MVGCRFASSEFGMLDVTFRMSVLLCLPIGFHSRALLGGILYICLCGYDVVFWIPLEAFELRCWISGSCIIVVGSLALGFREFAIHRFGIWDCASGILGLGFRCSKMLNSGCGLRT